jgi:hypothetical protein
MAILRSVKPQKTALVVHLLTASAHVVSAIYYFIASIYYEKCSVPLADWRARMIQYWAER